MKQRITWILGLMLAVPAWSAVTTGEQRGEQFRLRMNKNEDPGSPPTLAPIRMAPVKVSFWRSSYHFEDGNFSMRQEIVCEKQAEAPVFDARGLQSWSWTNVEVECETAIDGRDTPILLKVAPAILFRTWHGGDGTVAEHKEFFGYFYAQSESPLPEIWSQGSSHTERMDLDHLAVGLSKVKVAERQEGNARLGQEIWAEIEFRDEATVP